MKMDYLIAIDNVESHLTYRDDHEYLLVCEAAFYGEAEEKALNYYWQLKKSDKEYLQEISFDELADSNFETEKLIDLFGEKDGEFFKHIHEKYGREALYNCDIYFFETEDKGTLTPEDKLGFSQLSETTYNKFFRSYIAHMMDIIKVYGENYKKFNPLCEVATRI